MIPFAKQRRSWAFGAIGGFLTTLVLSGCSVGGRHCPRAAYAVPTPPPARLPEAPSKAPAPGMARVDGYWHWDGTHYVWVPGHWLAAGNGQKWQPAYVEPENDGTFVYHEGGLSCEAD